MIKQFVRNPICVGVALGMSSISLSQAAVVDGESAQIQEIITTGVVRPTTKFESSASVTHLSAEDMNNYAPRSTAEIFRNIPGIQAESSSGDANANVKVRGLPISSGGAKYVSFQEDGFPTMLIGDVAFATSDSFLRADTTISSVQSIRGGTASTQAFNSPGGIINFISKDGSVEGGSVGVTGGLDYDAMRVDGEYGGALGESNWTYHVGGFYRKGEGPREAESDIEEGYQVKATLAREFDKGSVKFHFKHLDDTVPTYLPIPARSGGGSSFDDVGIDFEDGTLFKDVRDCAPRQNNAIDCSKADGFEAEMTSIAFVGNYDFNDTFSGELRHRTATLEGQFGAPFPYSNFDDPMAGPSTRIAYFNTSVDDMDNDYTEVKLNAELGSVVATLGYVMVDQNIGTTWNFNQYYVRLDNALSPFNEDGAINGVLYGNPAFGNCCTREYDFDVEATAPYIALSGEIGTNLTWDASYRWNDYEVDGTYAESTVLMPLDVNGDGVIGGNEQEVPTLGARSSANYEQDFDSWSVGANYALNDDFALFFNVSEGGSLAAPDRVTGNLDANGDMLSSDSGHSIVKQWETGFKWQFEDGSLYLTYFDAETDEETAFEVTTQQFIGNSYESSGFEIEGDYDFGNGFVIKGSVTFTDAEITASTAGNKGNTPRRQADYFFNITPQYSSDAWTVGLNFVGTDEVYVQDNNDLKFDSYIVTNLFTNYFVNENLTLSLNVNNLFDEEGFTEGEQGSAVAGDLVAVRPINGRTTSLTLRYDF